MGHIWRGPFSVEHRDRWFVARGVWGNTCDLPSVCYRPAFKPAWRAAHAAVWHGCGCDWLRSSGFCHAGWMVFPILLLLAAGGVGMPALQAMLSNNVSSNKQGALQGTLTSLTNLSSIAGPLGFTALYSATAGAWNGWVWIVGAILYLICLPILRRPFATSL